METKTVSKIIKELTEQISLKEISTRDFVDEMKTLYEKIEGTETELERTKNSYKIALEESIKLRDAKEKYEKEFVIPEKEFKKKEIDLKYEHLDWKTEKKYLEKENQNLKMLLASITASKIVNESNGNGGYRNEMIDKPALT